MRRGWLAAFCPVSGAAAGLRSGEVRAVRQADGGAEIPAEKLVAITFDDGPRRDTTERLLDGLAERGASATFFLIGKQITGNEDLVERMAAEGHQVGSHTWNHVRLLGVLPGHPPGRRWTAPRRLWRALLGEGDYWLRPPYGAVDETDRRLISVPMIKWSVDPRDWELLDAEQVTAAVLEHAGPGQIILLHDIYPTSVDAALAVVDALQGQGYRFVTVAELLENGGIDPEPGVLYCSADG